MLYLESIIDGFSKKFILTKEESILGRQEDCDFVVEKPFVSRKHVLIVKNCNDIIIKDLNSKNGILINDERIFEKKIKINECFMIGNIRFELKKSEGLNLNDLDKTSKYFYKEDVDNTEITSYSLNIFNGIISYIVDLGIKGVDLSIVFDFAKPILNRILVKGELLIVKKENSDFIELSKIVIGNYKTNIEINYIYRTYDVLLKEIVNEKISNVDSFISFPLIKNRYGLLFLTRTKNITNKKIDFLKRLKLELGIILEKQLISKDNNSDNLIYTFDEKFLNILNKAKRIAKQDIFVLIEGETGTGKELVAKFIHRHSYRNNNKYIALNCSAIPDNLLESELFGYEKGAFTDASESKKGKLELANNGTLVLDEIGDMPFNLQAKLLRVFQEGKFYRLGGINPINVNLRVISLTNKNIKDLIKQRKFREDLYFRIAHYTFKLPPLRDRKNDIIILFKKFLNEFSNNKRNFILTKDVENLLLSYQWPGNIRELKHIAKVLVTIIDKNEIIDSDLLKSEFSQFEDIELNNYLAEAKEIRNLLIKNKWNKSKVASILGISRTALYQKIKKYGIEN